MTVTAQDLVNREVHLCLSSLISTLSAGAYGHVTDGTDLATLTEQAFDLACPSDDWEEAAAQAGWAWDEPAEEFRQNDTGDDFERLWHGDKNDWQGLCEAYALDPYQTEVYEHWAVSKWFGEKLQAKGEKVDFDFAGLVVWARTCTGQGIASDSVVEAICAELNRPEPTAWLSGADLNNATNPNA